MAVGFILSRQTKYYVWPPNLKKTFTPDSKIMPGINGVTHFNINSKGIRGEEFSENQDYRILAVGGSTTECLYLDQTKAWPTLLEQKLHRLTSRHIWVGNVGKSGMTSRDHLMQIQYLLPEYPGIDMIALLVGINDLMLSTCDAEYSPDFLNQPQGQKQQIAHAFSVCPYDKQQSMYKNTGMTRFLLELKQLFSHSAVRQDEKGAIYQKLRQQRKNALKLIDRLPDLTAALEEYRHNLDKIIDIAQAHGIRLLLMTQPSIWNSHMTPDEMNLLWKGRIGGEEYLVSSDKADYYSINALASGMRKYNDTLLQVCHSRKIECLDLAEKIPRNSLMFYDDVHFNDRGSQQVADTVFGYLQHTKPFERSLANH